LITQGYPLQAIEYEEETGGVRATGRFFVVGWLPVNEDRTQFRPVLVDPSLTKGATAFLADPTKLYDIEQA